MTEEEKALWRIADFIEPHWKGAGLSLTGDWLFEEIVKRSLDLGRAEEKLDQIEDLCRRSNPEPQPIPEVEDIWETLANLGVSMRALNALSSAELNTLEKLQRAEWIGMLSPHRLPNIGRKGSSEIRNALEALRKARENGSANG